MRLTYLSGCLGAAMLPGMALADFVPITATGFEYDMQVQGFGAVARSGAADGDRIEITCADTIFQVDDGVVVAFYIVLEDDDAAAFDLLKVRGGPVHTYSALALTGADRGSMAIFNPNGGVIQFNTEIGYLASDTEFQSGRLVAKFELMAVPGSAAWTWLSGEGEVFAETVPMLPSGIVTASFLAEEARPWGYSFSAEFSLEGAADALEHSLSFCQDN